MFANSCESYKLYQPSNLSICYCWIYSVTPLDRSRLRDSRVPKIEPESANTKIRGNWGEEGRRQRLRPSLFLSPALIFSWVFHLRLVFTSDGVGVGAIIRSVELMISWKSKTAFRFRLRLRRLRSAYDLVKTRLSESEAEAQEPNQSQSVGTCIVIGLSFRFCFRLRQFGFH